MSEYVYALCQFRHGDKMTSIPQNLPLKLGTLRISSHNIRELKAASLEKYHYLYRLYLDKNGLQMIESEAFARQQFLNKMYLSENNLINISAESFQGLKTLQMLRLDHNKLQRIRRGTFLNVPSITYLDLQVNSISVLEEGAFDRLDYLETLLLSSNKLRTINSGVFGNLMSLRQLELASNQLRTVEGGVFSCAPLVNKLVLKGNQLDKIPKEAIGGLESDALIGLESVATIDVSGCNITSIQNGVFADLRKITAVHLNNNPLNCDCHLSWLPGWLSRKPEVTVDDATCRAPSDISGTKLTAANLSSFVCSCSTCTKDYACSLVPNNCSCSKTWAGHLAVKPANQRTTP
ncbi:Slit 1 protein [Desmophyllum pertusum]|uniref:Slit 1 protein n=1 Tax=Desmophyllum pertusum TaxID=174260 RepID=A0A9W9Y9K7_9CNID|nr:Slit 1 protein [Desmophyllum pertusum]